MIEISDQKVLDFAKTPRFLRYKFLTSHGAFKWDFVDFAGLVADGVKIVACKQRWTGCWCHVLAGPGCRCNCTLWAILTKYTKNHFHQNQRSSVKCPENAQKYGKPSTFGDRVKKARKNSSDPKSGTSRFIPCLSGFWRTSRFSGGIRNSSVGTSWIASKCCLVRFCEGATAKR